MGNPFHARAHTHTYSLFFFFFSLSLSLSLSLSPYLSPQYEEVGHQQCKQMRLCSEALCFMSLRVKSGAGVRILLLL